MYDAVHPDRLPFVKALVQEQRKLAKAARRERKLDSRARKQDAAYILESKMLEQEQRKAAKAARLTKKLDERMKKQRIRFLNRFFDLPREIRDLIYDHAWTDTVLPFCQELTWNFSRQSEQLPRGPLLAAEYCSSGNYTNGVYRPRSLPAICYQPRQPPEHAWIWTSRQMFFESTKQFYRHTQITRSTLIQFGQRQYIHVIPQRRLYGSAYAFPDIMSTRRVSINVEETDNWVYRGRAAHGVVVSLFELLSMAKSVHETKTLLIHTKRQAKSPDLRDLFPGRLFEEMALKDLKQGGWNVTLCKEDDAGVVEQVQSMRGSACIPR